jgi:hypothetical protein
MAAASFGALCITHILPHFSSAPSISLSRSPFVSWLSMSPALSLAPATHSRLCGACRMVAGFNSRSSLGCSALPTLQRSRPRHAPKVFFLSFFFLLFPPSSSLAATNSPLNAFHSLTTTNPAPPFLRFFFFCFPFLFSSSSCVGGRSVQLRPRHAISWHSSRQCRTACGKSARQSRWPPERNIKREHICKKKNQPFISCMLFSWCHRKVDQLALEYTQLESTYQNHERLRQAKVFFFFFHKQTESNKERN